MILQAKITADEKTGDNPVVNKIFILPHGKLTSLQIIIPSGHVGLTQVIVFYQGHQIFPLLTGYFSGNDTHIILNPRLRIDSEPRELRVQFTNNDDTFDHSVDVIIEIDTQDISGISIDELMFLGLD